MRTLPAVSAQLCGLISGAKFETSSRTEIRQLPSSEPPNLPITHQPAPIRTRAPNGNRLPHHRLPDLSGDATIPSLRCGTPSLAWPATTSNPSTQTQCPRPTSQRLVRRRFSSDPARCTPYQKTCDAMSMPCLSDWHMLFRGCRPQGICHHNNSETTVRPKVQSCRMARVSDSCANRDADFAGPPTPHGVRNKSEDRQITHHKCSGGTKIHPCPAQTRQQTRAHGPSPMDASRGLTTRP